MQSANSRSLNLRNEVRHPANCQLVSPACHKHPVSEPHSTLVEHLVLVHPLPVELAHPNHHPIRELALGRQLVSVRCKAQV
jgi:hypothetical protein